MKAIVPENLSWQPSECGSHCVLLEEATTRVEMLELQPGAVIEPHSHKEQRIFICFVRSGGALLYLGGRLFRPQAGQTFECEPGDVLAFNNDTPHVTRVLLTRVGYKAGDRVADGKTWAELTASI
ncbi:MAG: hypothetical protein AMXMBFR33_58720 [Candidatus Xenobia bacterium]|jgi:quercetin dioxygenase-like cupin family protein